MIGLVILALCCCTSLADSSSTPIKITDKLVENFETLKGSNNSVLPFVQGESVKGWFSSQTTFIVSDGSSNVGGLYSFGDDVDRSLGAVTSLKTKTVVFGIAITSDVEIHEIDIKFTGEQWRWGGDIPDDDVLLFDYSVLTTEQYQNGGWGANLQGSSSLWTPVPALCFYSSNYTVVGPVRFTQEFSQTLPTRGMGPDKVLQLRWTAHNNRDGLAIDDFEVHATTEHTGGVSGDHGKWKILALAGWSVLGCAVVGIVIFAVSRWKNNRRLQYSSIINEAPQSGVLASSIGPYNAFQPNERQKFVGV